MYDQTLDYKIAKKYKLFPLALVKYKIRYPSYLFYVSLSVEEAIRVIEGTTCLTFVRLSSSSSEYSAHILEIAVSEFPNWNRTFRFTPKPEHGPERNAVVEVSSNDDFNSILARLLNAVAGLQYEHQRRDRDKYIKIYWKNIHKDYKADFTKILTYPPNLTKFKDFSYDSIMSVSPYYGSVNPNNKTPTIGKVGPDAYHGRASLKAIDVMRVNAIYRQLIHRWYFYGNLFLYKGPLQCQPK